MLRWACLLLDLVRDVDHVDDCSPLSAGFTVLDGCELGLIE